MKKINILIVDDNIEKFGIIYYLLKPFAIEVLIERIFQTISINSYDITVLEKQIINKLDNLGISIKTKGYLYIKKSIMIIIKKGIDNTNMAEIYEQLAKIYNSSYHSIEKAIRKSIDITFSYGNFTELNKIFEHDISLENGKTSNKIFIYKLAQNIIFRDDL